MKNSLPKLIFIVIMFCGNLIFPQTYNTFRPVSDTLIADNTNIFKISAISIIPFSEKIYVSGHELVMTDYSFSYSEGKFSLTERAGVKTGDTVIISYQAVSFPFRKEYKRRSLVLRIDDNQKDSIKVIKSETASFTSESIFGSDIKKSGSIVRGFTFGTNNDFTLNSGLRLQMSGRLSDDIEIVAALTDENTPIQAEGNTESLDELDKVFIELKHKNARGTFGDFDLVQTEGEFSKLSRKLQGLKAEFNVPNYSGTITFASARGKFNTNTLTGMDGNQGPYRLSGSNNENGIIIIAGSEKVYLDGVQMTRGENNDYIIEYSNAEITFTPKRLITSASRISVDFEYTDRNYKRNFFGTALNSSLFDNKLKVGVNYYREGDDQDSPVDISLSDDDRRILEEAGSDRTKAVKSGISLAVPDSLGNVTGVYTKIDTVVNGNQFSYYKYLPGESSSIYNVTFSYVGAGSGDYDKESLGNYKFVGTKNGSYLPVIFLPLPELKQLGSINLSASPVDRLNIKFELAGSLYNKNRFAPTSTGSSNGYARSLILEYLPGELKLGSVNLGKAGFSIRDRFIQKTFSGLDRINEVEFNRYYNISSSDQEDQVLREFSLFYSPVDKFEINSTYGHVKVGDGFSSDRFLSKLNYSAEKNTNVNFNLDYVNSQSGNVSTDWLRGNGGASYTFGIFKPGIDFLFESKDQKYSSSDSLLAASLKYMESSPFLEILNTSGIDASLKYIYREESFPLAGIMALQSRAYTQQYNVNYRKIREFSTSLNVSVRKKIYTDEFRTDGLNDNSTVLVLSQSKFSFLNNAVTGDLYYQTSTEQTAKYEKVFVKVTKGTGNYVYLGDLNNDGISEENEFQLTAYDGDFILITVPSDQLYPVVDLKTNTRWKIDFDKIFKGNDLWATVFKPLSSETFYRIEENSKAPHKSDIYLLKFSRFLNDSTTIRGSQLFQNDFYLFKNSSDLSFRFRFTQRRSLNQYSGGLERGFFGERALRIRFRMIDEISNQTEFVNQVDNLISPTTSNRARAVAKNDLYTDFSYRPVQSTEIGFKFQVGKSRDTYPSQPTEVDINSQIIRINLSFLGLGRLRLEAERTELNVNNSKAEIPFEILRGNVVGKNYYLRANFDYRIGGNVQTSLSYDFRIQGESKIVQTMKAEARAFF